MDTPISLQTVIPPVNHGMPAQIVGYSVAADGSLTDLHTVASPNYEPMKLYLIEGTSSNMTRAFIKGQLPDIPDTFFEAHLADTLSRVEHDIDGSRMFVAKWSRVANQTQVAWSREKRLREGNRFDVNHHDPVASRLDHEELVHKSQPYRPYDPIFEFTEKRQEGENNRSAAEAVQLMNDGLDEERIAPDDPEKLSRTRHRFRLSRAPFPGSDITAAKPAFKQIPLIRHAVRNSISIYQGKDNTSEKQIVVILFDPIHCRERIGVKYNLWIGGEPSRDVIMEDCFENERANLSRFVSQIEMALPNPALVPLATWSRRVVMTLVLEDEARLMGAIGRALDEMELTMASQTYEHWRNYAPAWRNHLYHQLDTLTYLADVLTDTMTITGEHETDKPPPGKMSDPALLLRVQTTRARMEALSRRLDSSFQTLTSTMSIIESEKAIQEAEEVTRLTNLAFFFIPLSLVASVFGMNVIEFDQRLTSWMWVTASLLITLLTYSIRFRQPLSQTIMSTPSAVRTLRWDVAFVISRRVLQFIRSWALLVFYPCFVAGFGVALWLVAEHPSLTPDARIGIGTALGVLPPIFAFLRARNLEQRKRPKDPSFLQWIFILLIVPAVGVSLWKLATTRAFDNNAKIGLAIGIFGFQFFTTFVSSLPIMLICIANCPDQRDFHTGVVKRIIPRSLQVLMRFAVWVAQGVVLWRVFVSSMGESGKIAISIVICGVLPFLASPFFASDQADRWPFKKGNWFFTPTFFVSIYADLIQLGFAGAISPAVWKLATSNLSEGSKIAIGIGAICTPWTLFLSF